MNDQHKSCGITEVPDCFKHRPLKGFVYFWIIVRVFNPSIYFAIIQMMQQLLSQMIWWWTAATWRRSWSTAWQESGRSEQQPRPQSGRGSPSTTSYRLPSLCRTSSWKWRPTSWERTCRISNMMISSWCWMSSAGTLPGRQAHHPHLELIFSIHAGFLFLFPVRLSSYTLLLFPRILWVFSLFLAAIPKEKKFFFIIFIW